MNEAQAFILADTTLNTVVQQITDEQWGMEMPATFQTSKQTTPPTLREVINYHAYDDAWVPDMLAGKTMDEVGADTFKGDLLGDNPKVSFAAIVEKACTAADGFTDFDKIVHCSFGDYKAREYLWQINSFRALRAYDIAVVIGADPTLPPELVQELWDTISPHAEEWRSYGVFPPIVEVPEHASLQDKLLGLTGRHPQS
jgi:hypothetical protein